MEEDVLRQEQDALLLASQLMHMIDAHRCEANLISENKTLVKLREENQQLSTQQCQLMMKEVTEDIDDSHQEQSPCHLEFFFDSYTSADYVNALLSGNEAVLQALEDGNSEKVNWLLQAMEGAAEPEGEKKLYSCPYEVSSIEEEKYLNPIQELNPSDVFQYLHHEPNEGMNDLIQGQHVTQTL